MSKTDAAYMKAYRAKKKLEAEANLDGVIGSYAGLKTENEALRAEVRHLKEELAKPRNPPYPGWQKDWLDPEPGFGHSRPAPKPGRK